MNCADCGMPLFDGNEKLCEGCSDRKTRRRKIRDESGYERRLTEEDARMARDIARGYA